MKREVVGKRTENAEVVFRSVRLGYKCVGDWVGNLWRICTAKKSRVRHFALRSDQNSSFIVIRGGQRQNATRAAKRPLLFASTFHASSPLSTSTIVVYSIHIFGLK